MQGTEFDEAEFFRAHERVDVLVARSVPTVDGVQVAFDELWPRRRGLEVAGGAIVAVPALDDLILTKRSAAGRRTSRTSACSRA